MPIRPENRGRYPDNWDAISAHIKEVRAGWRCECDGRCGRPYDHLDRDERCRNRHGHPAFGTGSNVVLTTAHLDHTPENCDPANLMALCQGCHLHYDREHHAKTSAATRRAEIEASTEPLFQLPGAAEEGDLMPAEPTMTRHADVSEDGLYRWSLHREWRDLSDLTQGPRWVTFVMLNPSTADGTTDDPTIRRCIGFAKSWGATGLVVVNLYAFRATSPTDLRNAPDPVGPKNDEILATFFGMAASYRYPIIAAWGNNARPDRVARVLQIPGAERLQALAVTKAGAPQHPLYLPSSAAPVPYLPARLEKTS